MFYLRYALLALVAGVLLSACSGGSKTAWQHYDECSGQTSSFRDMVACGKQRRAEYCRQKEQCGSIGESMVAYADSLVQSIDRGEMSEPQAQRLWIEFKTKVEQQQRQEIAQRQTTNAVRALAIPSPTTCYPMGNAVTCY